jgi:hypothetical protein
LKQQEEQKKQIALIHEAVAHFQNGANKRRQGLEGRTSNYRNEEETSDNCYWEVECAEILPRN